MSTRIKVLVADDHAVWRSGMRAELGEAFWVVGEAEDAPSAIELAQQLQPDVVAADLRMPDGGGLRVAAELSDRFPVVILTVSEAHDDLLAAIGAAASRGEPVFSASLAALVLGDFTRAATTPDGKPVKLRLNRRDELIRWAAKRGLDE